VFKFSLKQSFETNISKLESKRAQKSIEVFMASVIHVG